MLCHVLAHVLLLMRRAVVQVKVEYVRRHSLEAAPHAREGLLRNAQRREFPGAQPVSLSSDNRHLVSDFRRAARWCTRVIKQSLCG